jgi:glycosyltransferase involved in cell wall biosynthesis
MHHSIGHRRRWQVLPIPVEPPHASAADWHRQLIPGVPVIGFLGRLAKVKDVLLWLAVLADIARQQPIQGVICGDGAERAVIAAQIKALKLSVIMPGFVPAGQALQVMDVLLLTSRNEGLPVTIIEAAGCIPRAVPVVAPPVGGIRDLIRAGVVVGAPRRIAALSAACRRLLHDEAHRQHQLARAQRYAHQLAPSLLAGAYAQMYHRVSGENVG